MDRTARIAAPLIGWLLLTVCAGVMAKDSPTKLRAEISKTEQDYYALYNKLNAEPRFAIVCRNEKPTGTNFATRVCRPKYLLDAMRATAGGSLHDAITSARTAGTANAAGPNTGATTGGADMTGQPDLDEAFRQNLLDAQQKSPELLALGRKRDQLQKQLDDAMKN